MNLQPPHLPTLKFRLLVSCFVVLQIATIIWVNLPESCSNACSKWIDASLSPWNAYRAKHIAWRWQQYAYTTGIDNRWQMFGRQSRFNWWYDIRAIYSDGEKDVAVLLPLPNQSERTFLQQTLFDLKERKFQLNIYLNEVARESYSRYLIRQYPVHDGFRIKAIRWHLCTQRILPPQEAMEKQILHDPVVSVRLLNEFKVNHEVADPKFVAWSTK